MYKCVECGVACDDGLCKSCKKARDWDKHDVEQHEDEWGEDD